MGSNPVVSAPRAAHVEERLRSLDFLAVCDVVLSETAALADVVLPVTQWAEETGTTTSLEGRVLLRRRAIGAPEGVRSDLEVLHELADRLGVEKGFPTEPEEVFEELRRASARRSGGLLRDRLPAAGGGERGVLAVSGAGRVRTGTDRTVRTDGFGQGPPRPPSGIPAPPVSSSTASPPTTGGPGSCPSRTVRAPGAGRRVSGAADHQAGRGAVPVGRADPAGGRAERRRARPLRGVAPSAGGAAGGGRGRSGGRRVAARAGGGAGPHHHRHPARHRVHAVPLGGRGRANT